MNVVLLTILTLVGLGVISAVVLYMASKKFYVFEDTRIDVVEEILPATNCGGCGFPGCRAFAEALVKADDISSMNCPVGGSATMAKVAEALGKVAGNAKPQVAVVRCNGTCEHRLKLNNYDGAISCAVAAALYGGETGCSYGCLGCGDCVEACKYDAMYMDEETGLPVIIEDKCIACGKCVEACPLEALSAQKSKLFGLAGYQRPVAERDNARCLRCKNGAIATNYGRFETVERVAAACNRACVAALEERNLGSEKFKLPFRQSAAWGRDINGEKVH